MIYARSVGRIVTFLLVLIVVALGARVLFVDATGSDEADARNAQAGQLRPPPLHEQLPAAPTAEALERAPAGNPITVIDPDPDLDQNTEPADCHGNPEPPAEPKPDSPAPH